MKKKNPLEEIKLIETMTIRELHDWLNWAEGEISEYQAFIFKIKEELKKR